MRLIGKAGSGRLQRLGCWRVDPDLLDYLAPLLRQHWPGLQLIVVDDPQALRWQIVDAWLLGEVCPQDFGVPTLLFGPLARRDRLHPIGDARWRLDLPSTGRRLLEHIQRVLT